MEHEQEQEQEQEQQQQQQQQQQHHHHHQQQQQEEEEEEQETLAIALALPLSLTLALPLPSHHHHPPTNTHPQQGIHLLGYIIHHIAHATNQRHLWHLPQFPFRQLLDNRDGFQGLVGTSPLPNRLGGDGVFKGASMNGPVSRMSCRSGVLAVAIAPKKNWDETSPLPQVSQTTTIPKPG